VCIHVESSRPSAPIASIGRGDDTELITDLISQNSKLVDEVSKLKARLETVNIIMWTFLLNFTTITTYVSMLGH